MTEIEDFILNHSGAQRTILEHMHHLISGYPNVVGKIRYKIPFYYKKSWICYLNPTKAGGIELAFPRGNELADEAGLLEAKGRKQVRSITYNALSEIDDHAVNAILQEAFLLDDHVAYASKRTRIK